MYGAASPPNPTVALPSRYPSDTQGDPVSEPQDMTSDAPGPGPAAVAQWVVMPTYNEIENLPTISAAVLAALPRAVLLVVDDNSPDGTGKIADELAAQPGQHHCSERRTHSVPSPRGRGLLHLIAPAVKRFPLEVVPPDTIVIHGEEDDVVALADVLAWARPQQLPIIVFPGCAHFFHGRLPQLQRVITGMWQK